MSHEQASIARRVTRHLGAFTRWRLRRRGYRESKATDRWSAAELRAYHDRRLVELVRFAAARIPFYRDLYARAGVDVTVLEKHADFLRDFRGDTIHASTLDIMSELGLLDALLARRRPDPRLPIY